MRTTVEISDGLFRRAKGRAASEGTSLRAVIEAALSRYLGSSQGKSEYRLEWQTDSGELLPGLNIHDRRELMDLMDSPAEIRRRYGL